MRKSLAGVRQSGFEVGRERRGNLDRGSRHRMLEGEPACVQKLPLEPEIPGPAVQGVARDGQVDGGEMDADLMRPPGLEGDAQQRVTR